MLNAEQVQLLRDQLRKMRHDINNHLAVIQASVELIRQRPEMAEKLINNLANKPEAITGAIKGFSAELEKALQPPAQQ